MEKTDIQKNKKQNVCVDISEELEELERYIGELSTFMPMPFCIVNPSDMILNVNKAFCNLTEYDELEIVGEEISKVFGSREEAENLREEVLKEGLVRGKEMILLTKSGKKINISVSASLRKDRDNEIIGYFFAFSDISELKKLQRQLEQKVDERTRQLSEKINELERFNQLAVGRELKMVELKREIEKLREQLEKANGK
jgi:PAS domain S-box-containing protein